MNETYLYTDSFETAQSQDETALWRASHMDNVACKKAIEKAILENFDGTHLDANCAGKVIKEFGFRRVKWVLANTLREKYLRKDQAWASQTPVPPHIRNIEFAVDSPPAGLDAFVALYRKAYQKLGLFTEEHCEPNSRSELDYEGKVLVLSPDILKESYWTPQDQLWYALSGFGCSPSAIGRSIRCTCLGDNEETSWNRVDFIGVLREEYLPDWAAPRLAELRGQQAGMQMK